MMPSTLAARSLLIVLVVCGCLAVGVVSIPYFTGELRQDSYFSVLFLLLKAFGTFLSLVVGWWLSAVRSRTMVLRSYFHASLVFVILWGVWTVLMVAKFAFGTDERVEALIAFLSKVPPLSGFLVAAALGALLSNSHPPGTPATATTGP